MTLEDMMDGVRAQKGLLSEGQPGNVLIGGNRSVCKGL